MRRIFPDIPIQYVQCLIDWVEVYDFLEIVETIVASDGIREIRKGRSPTAWWSAS